MARFIRNHWILIAFLFLLVLLSLPLLHFGLFYWDLSQDPAEIAYFQHDPAPEVGICLNDLAESRWEEEKAVWLREAETKRLPVQIRVAHHSVERQIRQIRRFIRQNVKVLILVPVSRTGLADVLKEATQNGIKIILYDEMTDGPADFYCGIDYLEAGRVQADALMNLAGPGNYLLLRGPSDSYKAELIAQGQQQALRAASKSRFRLLPAISLPQWSAEEAVLKTRVFTLHQKVKAILAPNDLIVQEIGRYFQSQKADAPFLAAIGTEASFDQRLNSEPELMAVTADYTLLARTALDIAGQYVQGKPVAGNGIIHYGSQKTSAWLLRNYLIRRSQR